LKSSVSKTETLALKSQVKNCHWLAMIPFRW